MGRPIRILLAAAAAAWLTLLITAPGAGLGIPAAAATYLFGSVVCHQQPDRSFHLGAAQLPVCARCAGLYAGAAVVFWFAALQRFATPHAWRGAAAPRLLLLAAAAPTALTWGAEAIGLWSPGNAVRFAAALPLGAAVAVTVNYVECARTQPSGSRRPPTRT